MFAYLPFETLDIILNRYTPPLARMISRLACRDFAVTVDMSKLCVEDAFSPDKRLLYAFQEATTLEEAKGVVRWLNDEHCELAFSPSAVSTILDRWPREWTSTLLWVRDVLGSDRGLSDCFQTHTKTADWIYTAVRHVGLSIEEVRSPFDHFSPYHVPPVWMPNVCLCAYADLGDMEGVDATLDRYWPLEPPEKKARLFWPYLCSTNAGMKRLLFERSHRIDWDWSSTMDILLRANESVVDVELFRWMLSRVEPKQLFTMSLARLQVSFVGRSDSHSLLDIVAHEFPDLYTLNDHWLFMRTVMVHDCPKTFDHLTAMIKRRGYPHPITPLIAAANAGCPNSLAHLIEAIDSGSAPKPIEPLEVTPRTAEGAELVHSRPDLFHISVEPLYTQPLISHQSDEVVAKCLQWYRSTFPAFMDDTFIERLAAFAHMSCERWVGIFFMAFPDKFREVTRLPKSWASNVALLHQIQVEKKRATGRGFEENDILFLQCESTRDVTRWLKWSGLSVSGAHK